MFVTDEMVDAALFCTPRGGLLGEDLAMPIDFMGLGQTEKLDLARQVMRAALTAALASMPKAALSLDQLDEAFAAEIERVSTLEYNSNAICRHFYGELRKRMEKPTALASMWRPIEEARGVVVSCYSKDSYGPRIIAYPGRGGGVVTARWWQHTDGTCNFLDDGGNAIYPNVFMPLPAPPVQQKEGV